MSTCVRDPAELHDCDDPRCNYAMGVMYGARNVGNRRYGELYAALGALAAPSTTWEELLVKVRGLREAVRAKEVP